MQTLLAFSLGIIPAIIWLWFWLREDCHPEPKKFIFLTFLMGMFSAIATKYVSFELIDHVLVGPEYGFYAIVLLASAEEIMKYLFAYFTALRRAFNDEPIDAVIYMITIALGFAAMENFLYLWDMFGNGEIAKGVIVGNMRFIGATTLHTASSGILGAMIALSYYKTQIEKIIYLIVGIILASSLHTAFNFLIINDTEGNIFKVFMIVWLAIMFLLLFFERIKKLKDPLLNKLKIKR